MELLGVRLEMPANTPVVVLREQLDEPRVLPILIGNWEAKAIHDALEGISLTRIESRPKPHGRWEYVFFVDIEGHQSDPQVARALVKVQERASLLRVLGSYPHAVL